MKSRKHCSAVKSTSKQRKIIFSGTKQTIFWFFPFGTDTERNVTGQNTFKTTLCANNATKATRALLHTPSAQGWPHISTKLYKSTLENFKVRSSDSVLQFVQSLIEVRRTNFPPSRSKCPPCLMSTSTMSPEQIFWRPLRGRLHEPCILIGNCFQNFCFQQIWISTPHTWVCATFALDLHGDNSWARAPRDVAMVTGAGSCT